MTTFTLDLINFDNSAIETDIGFSDLQYSRAFGSVGSLVVTIPPYYRADMFGRDSILRLYRTPKNGKPMLEPSAVWFVRKIGRRYQDGSTVLTCVDQMDLLRRRIVGYRQYTTYADKTYAEYNADFADDMMKEYVNENLGSGAVVDGTAITDTDRDLSSWISIEPNKSLGPEVEQSGAFQRLSDVLDGIKNKAADFGVDLYYDMRVKSDGLLEFVTPILAVGTAHGSSFEFNADSGNLADLVVEEDYTDEVTFAYVTCGGIGIGQHYIKVASNREKLTPFNRIEVHVPAEENNDTFLQKAAAGVLNAGKPKARISAQVIDSPLAVYGVDFNYGDRVSVTVFGKTFDCLINAIRNDVSDGAERLRISLEGAVIEDPDEVSELETWSARNFVHSTSVGGYMEIAPP